MAYSLYDPPLSDLGCKPVVRNNMLHDPSYYAPAPKVTVTTTSCPNISPVGDYISDRLAEEMRKMVNELPLPTQPAPSMFGYYTPPTVGNPMQRRIVTVVVSDPLQSDIDEAVLFHDTLTVEGSDEDVFHEIGISDILEDYNSRLSQLHAGKDEEGPARQAKMSQLKKQIITVAHL